MKDLIIIIPYFAEEWPAWVNFFLQTCKYNSWIKWLFFTNIDPPENCSEVTEFIKFSLDDFKNLVKKKLEIDPTFTNPYKICDYRMTFGKLFEDYLDQYKYYGFGDIDLIYGDLGKFLLPLMDLEYDAISLARSRLTGHLGLIKNNINSRKYFSKLNNWKEILLTDQKLEFKMEKYDLDLFDREAVFAENIDPLDLYVYKRKKVIDDIIWDKGRLYINLENRRIEVPLFHFYMFRRTSWKIFKDVIKIDYREPRWRINKVGFM